MPGNGLRRGQTMGETPESHGNFRYFNRLPDKFA
jgi:hypothetical protein